MSAICCTHKLLQEMGVDPKSLANPELTDFQNIWYANLVRVRRHKVVVFINAATCFVTIAFKPTRQDLKALPRLLTENLSTTLITEGVEETVVSNFIQPLATAAIAKTTDRKVLGCLNDVIQQLKVRLALTGEEISPNLVASTVKSLNRLPWVKRTPNFAIEGMAAILRDRFDWQSEFGQM